MQFNRMIAAAVMALGLMPIAANARMPSNTEQSIISGTVKADLVDPDSAKFDFVDLGKPKEPQFYCAYVNAKNHMGGYSGKRIFEVMLIWRNGKLADAINNGLIDLSAFDSDPRMHKIDQDKLTELCPDQVDELQF